MNASLFFRLSALVVALFLGGCAVAPDAPVTGIATPLSPTQARQLLRNMHGALSFGTSIAAHTEDIRTVRVGRDSVTINRQRLAFQDWIMHECCKQAHDRGWPHQVHVGTHNLPHHMQFQGIPAAEPDRPRSAVRHF